MTDTEALAFYIRDLVGRRPSDLVAQLVGLAEARDADRIATVKAYLKDIAKPAVEAAVAQTTTSKDSLQSRLDDINTYTAVQVGP